jgi:hypothetical protein
LDCDFAFAAVKLSSNAAPAVTIETNLIKSPCDQEGLALEKPAHSRLDRHPKIVVVRVCGGNLVFLMISIDSIDGCSVIALASFIVGNGL